MSPQLEHGYTKIADAILEKVAKTKLNGTQFRILMIVWRSTYGWEKKQHELSLSYLASKTDIHKQQIKREVDKMIEDGILTVLEESTYTKPRTIGFNKNYVKSIQSTEKVTVSENADSTVSELVYPTVSENADHNKHINKQKEYTEVFDYYLSLDLINHRSLTGDMKKAIDKAKKELGVDTEYMKRMLKRHDEKVKATKNKDYPIKARPLAEFFGQKKYGGVSLICTDYLDENYDNKQSKPQDNNPYSGMRRC